MIARPNLNRPWRTLGVSGKTFHRTRKAAARAARTPPPLPPMRLKQYAGRIYTPVPADE
jgi:hypothetical protein